MKTVTRGQAFGAELERWMNGNSQVRLAVEALKRSPTEKDMDEIIGRSFLEFKCHECDKEVGVMVEFGDYLTDNYFAVCHDCLISAIGILKP